MSNWYLNQYDYYHWKRLTVLVVPMSISNNNVVIRNFLSFGATGWRRNTMYTEPELVTREMLLVCDIYKALRFGFRVLRQVARYVSDTQHCCWPCDFLKRPDIAQTVEKRPSQNVRGIMCPSKVTVRLNGSNGWELHVPMWSRLNGGKWPRLLFTPWDGVISHWKRQNAKSPFLIPVCVVSCLPLSYRHNTVSHSEISSVWVSSGH